MLFRLYLKRHNPVHRLCPLHKLLVVNYLTVLKSQSLVLKDFPDCLFNSQIWIIINTPIQFPVIMAIKSIIKTSLCMLDSKIPVFNLVSNFCIMQVNFHIHLLCSIDNFRIIPPFYILIIQNIPVHAIDTLDKIEASRQREAVLDAKGFPLMVWQTEICLQGFLHIRIFLYFQWA